MKPCIVLFGVDPMTVVLAQGLFQPQGVAVIAPDRRDYLQPLSYFLGACAPLPLPPFSGAFPEPLVLLCHLESQLEEVLRQLGQVRLGPGVLKAVLTPHNQTWNAPMLLEELQRERASTQGAK